jgi:hypothetical protein
MIDVEVTSLTQKSMLHGKGRLIHLPEVPLSAVPAMEGNTVCELWAVQTTRGTHTSRSRSVRCSRRYDISGNNKVAELTCLFVWIKRVFCQHTFSSVQFQQVHIKFYMTTVTHSIQSKSVPTGFIIS